MQKLVLISKITRYQNLKKTWTNFCHTMQGWVWFLRNILFFLNTVLFKNTTRCMTQKHFKCVFRKKTERWSNAWKLKIKLNLGTLLHHLPKSKWILYEDITKHKRLLEFFLNFFSVNIYLNVTYNAFYKKGVGV